MSKKYIILSNEDNSFSIENGGETNNFETETKDMVSFSLQYLYTVLNPNEIMLSESAKEKVVYAINSFEFEKGDIEELSRLIVKIGDKMNKSMMTLDNGIPKMWDDEV
jgi:hypothetical protein